MTGEVTALITSKRCSKEFLDFLRWLVEDIYQDKERIYLFLDNCSIHHTQAVREYIANSKGRLVVIWNATYAPNLNLIERFWGHLKRSAIHNYYFETVENLEKAIIESVKTLNRQKDHPLRMHLQTVQDLSKAA
jgi:putative transposase